MRFWVPIVLSGFWSNPGWTHTYGVNQWLAPRWGLLTPCRIERTK